MISPREVLFVGRDSAARSAWLAALDRRGHRVECIDRVDQDSPIPSSEVVVCDLSSDGERTLAALAAWRAGGAEAQLVLLAPELSIAACRAALHLAVDELLLLPSSPEEVVQAVELAGPRAALPSRGDAARFVRGVRTEIDRHEQLLRELCGFLARAGLSPATRARVLTATAELLENVLRHAFADGSGRSTLTAAVGRRSLEIVVADQGAGFDPVSVLSAAAQSAHSGGLSRVAALCEDLRVDAAVGRGARVTLGFTAFRVEFDEGDRVDLSELDWLSPSLARRVLASLREGRAEPAFELSPALAVSVGRMLAGPSREKSLNTVLWS